MKKPTTAHAQPALRIYAVARRRWVPSAVALTAIGLVGNTAQAQTAVEPIRVTVGGCSPGERGGALGAPDVATMTITVV